MMTNFEELLNKEIDLLEDSTVKEAMRYSLLAGGKRLRPLMVYVVAKGYGIEAEIARPFACALEMIHTYSLIHDDLPAMDNDSLRRGKPTCHIQYGEANAILAGDGLLTYAFEVMAKANVDPSIIVKGIQILSKNAGASGMILGQCLDVDDNTHMSFDELKRVHYYKTGCLFSAALTLGAILANKEDSIINQWDELGKKLGLAFQIQDDLLDVHKTAEELGKSTSDERNGKATSVTILGEDKATALMNELYQDCINQINNFEEFEPSELIELVKEVITRNK